MRPALLERSHNRIKKEYSEDNRGVGGLSHPEDDARRGEKDVDERALELPRKNDEKAIRLPFRKFVGTVFLKTRLCFLFRQAALARMERVENLGNRFRMP